ncbi:hypothetical protein HanRHA438_Chr01g0000361 [Helianthus annuus]|nr:hypothetical protein HanIR_Chr01g0000411 [Helianthus annuus]KAJ0946107.1 hypothetical protein HanRHA438_Chr01g0000361 [Helianthus annuus]
MQSFLFSKTSVNHQLAAKNMTANTSQSQPPFLFPLADLSGFIDTITAFPFCNQSITNRYQNYETCNLL